MDWGALFDYLGAGGGLLVILNWIVGLPVLRKKSKLDKDDVSRHMAEKDNQLIIELFDEIRGFQERMARLEGCVAKIVVCPIYDRCPARPIVQEYKRKYYYPQRGNISEQKGVRPARDNTAEPGGDTDTGIEPP